MRWEYLTAFPQSGGWFINGQHDPTMNGWNANAMLAAAGKDGWELVSITPNPFAVPAVEALRSGYLPAYIYFYFKRPGP